MKRRVTTKTASYRTSFFLFFLNFHLPRNRAEKKHIMFASVDAALFFLKKKGKSRFSIKFQTFWWKLSRFYCWKRNNEEMKTKWKGSGFLWFHKNLVYRFFAFSFSTDYVNFMKNVSAIFSSQIHKHLSANSHVSDVNGENVKVHITENVEYKGWKKSRSGENEWAILTFCEHIIFIFVIFGRCVIAERSLLMAMVTSKSWQKEKKSRHAPISFHYENVSVPKKTKK